MAIGALAWNLVADHRKFTEGLVVSRRELSISKRVMESTRTPAEKYGDQLDAMRNLLNKSTISVDDYNRAATQLKAELPQNAAAQKTLTDELTRAKTVTQSLMTVEQQEVAQTKRSIEAIEASTRLRREGIITEEKHRANLQQISQAMPAVVAAEKRRHDEIARGKTITQSLLSPTERYQQELRELNTLLQVGAINQSTYNRGVERLNSQLPLVETRLSRVRRGLNGVTSSMGNVGAVAGFSVGLYSIGMSMRSVMSRSNEFAQSMASSLAIVDNVSDQTRARMELTAKQVAYHTRFSTADAAKSYFFLESAGLTVEQSIAALPTAAKFAQAGMFDMSQATDLLTDAQSALGLTVDDAAQNMRNMTVVSDSLVAANTLANATVEQFSKALTTKAGAALRMVGKDIQEGTAVLAAFADQGIKGEEAGTALNIVFRDMQTKALDNAAAFKANRIAVYDAAGEMRNTADIIEDMEQRLDGLSDAAKKQILLELGFSDKSVAFTQSLIGTSSKIRQYEKDIRAAGGITEDVAAKQMPPLTVAMNKLGAVWDTFSIQIGTPIAESLAGASGEAGALATVLKGVVDVGATVVGVSKLVHLGFVTLSHPIQSLEIFLARARLKVAELAEGVAESSQGVVKGIAKALGPALGSATGMLDFTSDAMSQKAAADLAKVEDKYQEHNDRMVDLSQNAKGYWDRLLDGNESPGAKFLQTIQDITQPLKTATDAQQTLTDAVQASVPAFDSAWQAEEFRHKAAERFEKFREQQKRNQEERLADAEREREQMFASAASAVDSLKTAEEKYQDKLADLNKWLQVGAISYKQFGQLRDAAAKEIEKPIEINFEVKGLEANVAGSAQDLLQIEEQIAKARSMSTESKVRSTSQTSGLDNLYASFNANAASIRSLSSESGGSSSPAIKTDNSDLAPALAMIAENTGRMVEQTKGGTVLMPANL